MKSISCRLQFGSAAGVCAFVTPTRLFRIELSKNWYVGSKSATQNNSAWSSFCEYTVNTGYANACHKRRRKDAFYRALGPVVQCWQCAGYMDYMYVLN